MADDPTLVSALQSLTSQIEQLNRFMYTEGVTPTPVQPTQTAADRVQEAIVNKGFTADNVADAGAAVRAAQSSQAVPDVPSIGPNLAPSNSQTAANDVANAMGATGSGGGGGEGPGSNMNTFGEVLAASQLGAHGPQLYRDWRLGTYNFQQNLNLAGNLANNLSELSGTGSMNTIGRSMGGWMDHFINYQDADGNMTGSPQGLNIFGNRVTPTHMQAIASGLQVAGTVAKNVGSIDDWLGTQATIGQTFGYGPGAGGNAIFGVRNPLTDISTAQRVGMGFAAEKNTLTGRNFGSSFGGSGITSDQAQQILDTLANQGFSMNPSSNPYTTAPSGDAATIANQFMAPVMAQMPGMSADTLSQFTPAMRNSATSAQQLAESLSNVGQESRNAKESVNQFTTSVASAAQSFANMGSGFAQSIGTAQGFSDATGLDPQVAAQLAQSPIVQGLALGQGVLPSGLGSMGGGAFTNTSLEAVKMLAGGLKSLNYDTYSRKDGTALMTRNGQQMQDAQVASMLGIPESVVQRMLGSGTRYQHVADAENLLGSATSGTGMWGAYQGAGGKNASGQSRETLNRDWSAQIVPSLREAGVSSKHIQELSEDKNWKDRLEKTNQYLTKIGGGGDMNKINGTNVTVGLTAQAAKILKITTGPSDSKLVNNAGGQTISQTINTQAQGDISNPSRYGVTPDTAGQYFMPRH